MRFYFSIILFSFLWSLGIIEVVDVWNKFFDSPTTENCKASYEGRAIRETSKTGRLV